MFKSEVTSRMNQGTVLLLVGALFVAGGVDATRITLMDAKHAIDVAWANYLDLVRGNIRSRDVDRIVLRVHLSSGAVINGYCWMRDGYMNCGIPGIYSMANSDFRALKTWFVDDQSTTFGGTGTILDPMYKRNLGFYQANAVYRRRDYSFNFHLAIDMTGERRMNLLKLLLARVVNR